MKIESETDLLLFMAEQLKSEFGGVKIGPRVMLGPVYDTPNLHEIVTHCRGRGWIYELDAYTVALTQAGFDQVVDLEQQVAPTSLSRSWQRVDGWWGRQKKIFPHTAGDILRFLFWFSSVLMAFLIGSLR